MQSTPTKPSVIHFFSSIWVVNKSGINIEIEHRRIGLTRKHDCIPTRCRGTVSSPVILAVKPGKVRTKQEKREEEMFYLSE